GTFRGNNHAFVTATAALKAFWQDDAFQQDVQRKGDMMRKRLDQIVADTGLQAEVRGRGLFLGIDCEQAQLADEIAAACFERTLLIDTAAAHAYELNIMLPLNTTSI